MTNFPRVIPGRLFLENEWVDAGDGATERVYNPATEAEVGTIARATDSDIDRALGAAADGLARWRATDAWTRSTALRGMGAVLRDWAPRAAELLTTEQGKPLREAQSEWAATIDQFDWYADEARRIYGRIVDGHRTDTRILVRREPVGIVAAFAAWNFPALLPARKIAPALAAGCAVIVRPTEEAPFSTLLLAAAAREAGIPPGVITMVTGDAARISERLVESGQVRKLSFTGSVPVGQHLLRLAADKVISVSMELGGHAPVVVFDDANVQAAARACAAAKFRNAGQVCAAPSRFIVAEAVAEEFTAEFVAAARHIRIGDGTDPATDMGPVTSVKRLEAAEQFISDAVAGGATLAAGGRRAPGFQTGYFFEPTVLTDLTGEELIMREEPFVPVAPIARFGSFDEAVKLANATRFGLASYVWTRDLSTAFRASETIEAGMVGINNMSVATAEAPFGGVKHSGFGREGGLEAIDDYTVTKTTFLTL